MKQKEKSYIIKKNPQNKSGISKSRIYSIKHINSYLKEMVTGEKVTILKGKKKLIIQKQNQKKI